MSKNAEALKAAALGILREKRHEQDSESLRRQALAVYVNSTPTPDDSPDIVKITEAVFKEHAMAVALFHTREAERFESALTEAEKLA